MDTLSRRAHSSADSTRRRLTVKVQALGHVVVRVRNQQRAEEFYNGVLGLPICARLDDPSMTFFSPVWSNSICSLSPSAARTVPISGMVI